MADTSRSTRPRLGRGLSSLISNSVTDASQAGQYQADAMPTDPEPSYQATIAVQTGEIAVPVTQIAPNPYQPRRQFSPDELEQIAGLNGALVEAYGEEGVASKHIKSRYQSCQESQA